MLYLRISTALAGFIVASIFYEYVSRHADNSARSERELLLAYLVTRVSIWLSFLFIFQHYVINSDPKYYIHYLDKFLAGLMPVRDFFYPYGPFLIAGIIPFYLLLGKSLAGISLFAICAEAVALTFFLKAARLSGKRGEMDRSWLHVALAVYLLNPATLYYTVLQGYHSITQTAYSMAALFLLLRGRETFGYGVGFFGLAGSKLLSVLDWPAMLGVAPPRWSKLILGAAPLVAVYVIFGRLAGGIRILRHVFWAHLNVTSEGNLWFALTIFPGVREFYSGPVGASLPCLSFAILFLIGLRRWLFVLRSGRFSYGFIPALAMSTFTISLFFLCSRYNPSYYLPMLMLPASLIVAKARRDSRRLVWLLLLLSALSLVGGAFWVWAGGPPTLRDVFGSASAYQRLLAGFWTASIIVRATCFAILARESLRIATGSNS